MRVNSPAKNASKAFRFDYQYLGLALVFLLIEVVIALFVHDDWVRPHGGDLLASVFLYCLLRGIWPLPTGVAAGLTLLLSYLIEALQYGHLLRHLGWQHSRVARVLLGSTFEWADLLAYTMGVALVLLVEQRRSAKKLIATQRSE